MGIMTAYVMNRQPHKLLESQARLLGPDTQFPCVRSGLLLNRYILVNFLWGKRLSTTSREIHTNSYLMELMLKCCVCQLCANLINTSWMLETLTQPESMVNKRVFALRRAFSRVESMKDHLCRVHLQNCPPGVDRSQLCHRICKNRRR